MSSEENFQSINGSECQNENLCTGQSSINDMKNSSDNNSKVQPITSDNSCGGNLENVNTGNELHPEYANYCGGTNSGFVDENIVRRVRQLNISEDNAVNIETTTNREDAKRLASQFRGRINTYSVMPDGLGDENNTNIQLSGLRLGNLDGNDDDDEYEDSEEDSQSGSEGDSENGEEIEMKKRKVQGEDSWLSVLGVDKVSTELPDISTLGLNNKEEFTHMGDLECVIDKIVTIAGLPGMPAYDLDTLLFLEDGQKVLGYVLDVMGPVTAPVYVVPMSSSEAIQELQLRKGTKVYCAPKSKYTKYVLLQELMKVRGSDPSSTKGVGTTADRPESAEDEQSHSKEPTKDKKRNCSSERHRQFVIDMNRANERDTKLHKMADSHRLHLEHMGGVQFVSRQARDSRTRNQGCGDNQHSEGRRSRSVFRNNAQVVTTPGLENWTVVNPVCGVVQNGVPVISPFENPFLPSSNCAGSNILLPTGQSMFPPCFGFIPHQNFVNSSVDFERSINRPNFRNNMPGPSNDSFFN